MLVDEIFMLTAAAAMMLGVPSDGVRRSLHGTLLF